jgi:trk system potassium uptake protein TrkA
VSRRFLVVGLGSFGVSLAESLTQAGVEVMAVDKSMANVEAIRDKVALSVQLDATDADALRDAECTSCQLAAVTIGDDFEMAVLTVAALREVGMQRVLARARTHRQARILRAVGASQVIEVEWEMGQRLGQTLATEK